MVSFKSAILLFLTITPLATSTKTKCTPPDINTAAPPTKFGVLLFPGFEILDVAGPLSALNMLARQQSPPASLITISATRGPVSTNESIPFFESITATHSLRSPQARDLDVLLVPGGPGTRIIDNIYVDYVREVYPCLRYLLVVCTGSGLVARSGILDGRKATGNKAAWRWVVAQGPKVDWVREARWVVDGNIWTTSGVAAGLDGTFAWIKEVHGAELAEKIANLLEYERHEDWKWDPFSDVWNNTKL